MRRIKNPYSNRESFSQLEDEKRSVVCESEEDQGSCLSNLNTTDFISHHTDIKKLNYEKFFKEIRQNLLSLHYFLDSENK